MTKCTFCGKDEKPYKGTHLITNKGETNYFCSSKCLRNSVKLRRDKRKVRWTEAFHIIREKARSREANPKEAQKG